MSYHAFELARQEIRTCGECGHFDRLNQACWVVASDGIMRDVTEFTECFFGKQLEY